MEQTTTIQEFPLVSSSNVIPGYQKCLSCSDYGAACNGPSLGTLGDIASVRAFHRAMKKARGLNLKTLAAAAPEISDSTVNEYFSNAARDYKWTTVALIDNAIVSICGNRVGLPPLVHACPASSADIRQQLAAADLKVAAAELRAAQSETDMDALQQKLIEIKAQHISQINQIQEAHNKDTDWLKNDIRLWRRFSFILLGVGLILLIMLVFYIGWDVAHPTSGLIRY